LIPAVRPVNVYEDGFVVVCGDVATEGELAIE
jgi:hypothetical protein